MANRNKRRRRRHRRHLVRSLMSASEVGTVSDYNESWTWLCLLALLGGLFLKACFKKKIVLILICICALCGYEEEHRSSLGTK